VKHVVGSVEEIPPGSRKIVQIGRHSIGVFNLDGEFFALRNRCPHQGGPLCEGKLWGIVEAPLPGEFQYEPRREFIACPWHAWEFHIRTGQSWCDPESLRARRYTLTVEQGSALMADSGTHRVKGPYMAETYSVSTEGRYVVVDVPD